MNNHNGYQVVHKLLSINEMPTKIVLKRGAKKLIKNMKKDPKFWALATAPIPGSNLAVAGAAHMVMNKPSRNITQTMVSKLLNPSRAKDITRKIQNVKNIKNQKLMKYLNISKAIS